MTKPVNVTRNTKQKRRLFHVATIFFVLANGIAAFGQKTEVVNTEIVPFSTLLARSVNLRPEVRGVHPRLFFSSSELVKLRERAKATDTVLWQEAIGNASALKRNPPDPNDPELYKSGLEQRAGSISQYGAAFAITESVMAYAIEQDDKYLTAAKEWTLAVCRMPYWGYSYNKPNVDLPPAHLLYATAFAYDVLFHKLTEAEKEIIRDKLIKQGRLMYDHFKYKPGKRYTYTQNHTWIPMAGLAIAAYVLMDETEEAKDWARLARAIFDRTMLAFGTDGYFYEGFHYFGFAFRWVIRYFDAHLAVTGEDLYAVMKPKFSGMKYYAMHSILPDGKNVFDFGDTGDGALNRNETSRRESLYGEYDILYRLASVYNDSHAQAIADHIRGNTFLKTREPIWAFINRDPNLKPAALSTIPLQYHFEDNDTVFWRSSWTSDATAFAFRCAPPEGHHATRLAAKIPDWRQNTGHAHPDANSFVIWAKGKYLTGDTGYLGIKQTDDHNTLLINGRGQEQDGIYEMFKGVPNERLRRIRIVEAAGNSEYFYIKGEAASGYYSDLGLKKFDRHLVYISPGYFVVWDQLETEEPATFTLMLNADGRIEIDANRADLINGDTALRVERLLPFAAATESVPQKVQARGMPGTVDKGKEEQRGVQLRSTSVARQKKFEFIHFLKPYVISERDPLPSVSLLDNGGKGLKVVWGNGDVDNVYLDGNIAELQTAADLALVRKGADARVKKIIIKNGKEIRFVKANAMSSVNSR